MNAVYVVKAKRTVIGKKGGIHKKVSPEKLAAAVLAELGKALPVDGVIMGNAVGEGGNIARHSLLEAGFHPSVPGLTVDSQCGGGLEAIVTAARFIQAGAGDCYLAGGVESTSLEPARFRVGEKTPIPRASFAPADIGDPDMAASAESVAEEFRITRAQQDAYALESYRRAYEADLEGRFDEEKILAHQGIRDEGIRKLSERLVKRMPPLTMPSGTITAANSCEKSDGAAAVILMSEKACREAGVKPWLQFVDSVSAGDDPNYASISPIRAIQKLLYRNSLHIDAIGRMEFNEAYAAQLIACGKHIPLSFSRVNVSGGALTLGHPYGASGAINVCRLFHELLRCNMKYGIATVGAAGGVGTAALFKKVSVT
ncbi:acetyl-CoA C-acyltransferase [Bacillus sp. C1-1]|nr:acetyl-CoA C-acyltransferase [Bacillus sp. C1-1]